MGGERAPSPHGATTPTLSLRNVGKTFGVTRALNDVSIDVMPGEIHGLLGANGSGKSTLIKILAGFHAPDPGGRMRFNGEAVALPLKAADFRRLGMSFVHQELGLVPSLTVLENLRLSHIALSRRGYIDWRAETAAAEATLAEFELDVEPWRRIDEFGAVDRALLVIVRAFEEIRASCVVTGKPGLVLLDEPTPFLPAEGVEKLFDLMRRIAESGSSVIFISHDIDEVMAVTDRATVLRDGEVSGQADTDRVTHAEMVEMIIGRSLRARTLGSDDDERTFAPFARLEAVRAPGLEPCGLDIGRGEIVGLTGLIGSGHDCLPYCLFGAKSAASGSLVLADGRRLDLARVTPASAMAERFALLPGDRPKQSGVGGITVFENMMLPDLASYFTGAFLRGGRMKRDAAEWGATYEVRPNDPELNLAALSGGNAQKVLIARWMKRDPILMLLDEPTQGVDVGTRALIFAALTAAAGRGMSILCASSDAEQLSELCHRVLIFARGRVVAELTGTHVTKDDITQACYGSLKAPPPIPSPPDRTAP